MNSKYVTCDSNGCRNEHWVSSLTRLLLPATIHLSHKQLKLGILLVHSTFNWEKCLLAAWHLASISASVICCYNVGTVHTWDRSCNLCPLPVLCVRDPRFRTVYSHPFKPEYAVVKTGSSGCARTSQSSFNLLSLFISQVKRSPDKCCIKIP